MKKTAFVAIACLILAGCGGSKSPTAPADPNSGMYATWNGTLQVSWPSSPPTQDGITIVMSRGSLAFYMSGAQYPAAVNSMSDPSVSFTVNVFGYAVPFTGSRSGNTLQGTMSIPALGATGSWATTRGGPASPARSGRTLRAAITEVAR